MLQPGRLYVFDRGYLDHELYREILEAGSSFIGRIKDNGAYTVESQRPLTAADRAAGVVSDELLETLGHVASQERTQGPSASAGQGATHQRRGGVGDVVAADQQARPRPPNWWLWDIVIAGRWNCFSAG